MKKQILASAIGLSVCFTPFIDWQQSPWNAPVEANKLANPLKNNVTSVKAGENLFESQCSSCHGTTGKGDGMVGSSLTPHPTNLTSDGVKKESDGSIFWKISTGKSPMPSFGNLSKTQRWELVDFIRKLQTGNVLKKDIHSSGTMMNGNMMKH